MYLFLTLSNLLFFNTIPNIWVEVNSTDKAQMTNYTSKIKNKIANGGSLINSIVLNEEEGESNSKRVLFGPFRKRSNAFRFGMKIIDKPNGLNQFSLRRIDGTSISMKMTRAKRRKLLGDKQTKSPFPVIGISLVSTALCFERPYFSIPSSLNSIQRMHYRDELWLTDEKYICKSGNCIKWYHGITPSPHRRVWVPAGIFVPLTNVHSHKTENGKLSRYTAVIPIRKSKSSVTYEAFRFLRSATPYRVIFKLPRLFYLKLINPEKGKWFAIDKRGIRQYELSKLSQWRPVSSLFKNNNRRIFFR